MVLCSSLVRQDLRLCIGSLGFCKFVSIGIEIARKLGIPRSLTSLFWQTAFISLAKCGHIIFELAIGDAASHAFEEQIHNMVIVDLQ